MVASGDPTGLLAALRKFPQSELPIRRLMSRNENFRDMCQELADAEFALSKVGEISPDLQEVRRCEWEQLIARLTSEISAQLQDSQMWAARMAR